MNTKSTPGAFECRVLPTGETFPVPTGLTVLEAAEKANIKLAFGCRAGACGTCFVYILEGMDHLPAPSPIETDTLTELKKIGEGRLACRLKNLTGSITIQRR